MQLMDRKLIKHVKGFGFNHQTKTRKTKQTTTSSNKKWRNDLYNPNSSISDAHSEGTLSMCRAETFLASLH